MADRYYDSGYGGDRRSANFYVDRTGNPRNHDAWGEHRNIGSCDERNWSHNRGYEQDSLGDYNGSGHRGVYGGGHQGGHQGDYQGGYAPRGHSYQPNRGRGGGRGGRYFDPQPSRSDHRGKRDNDNGFRAGNQGGGRSGNDGLGDDKIEPREVPRYPQNGRRGGGFAGRQLLENGIDEPRGRRQLSGPPRLRENGIGMVYEDSRFGEHIVGMGRPRMTPDKRGDRFTRDEDGVKRKFVKGGRIKKNKKPRNNEEDDENLFCDACGYYLPDITAKHAHEQGRPHRKKVEENRAFESSSDSDSEKSEDEMCVEDEKENAEPDRPQSRGIPKPFVVPNIMAKETFNEYVRQMSADKNKPKSFDMWADRSLKKAKEQKLNTNAVHREIYWTYAESKERGTMLYRNWLSHPHATGRRYQQAVPVTYEEPVFTQDEVVRMESEAVERARKKKLEEVKKREEEEAKKEEDEKRAKEASKGSNTVNDSAASGSDQNSEEPEESVELLKKCEITWNLSSLARSLISIQQVPFSSEHYRSEIESKFFLRYKHVAGKKEINERNMADDREKRDALRAEAENMLKRFIDQFENDSPDLQDVWKEVEKFESELDSSPFLYRIRQDLLYNFAKFAVESLNGPLDPFVLTSLDKLINSFERYPYSKTPTSKSVAFWVISLLYSGLDKDSSRISYIDKKISVLPPYATELEGFKYAAEVVKCVLHGNHTRLFDIYENSPFHIDCHEVKEFISPFVELARHRMLAMFRGKSPCGDSKTFLYNRIGYDDLMSHLRYQKHDENDYQEKLQEVGLSLSEDHKYVFGAEDSGLQVKLKGDFEGVDTKFIVGFLRKANERIVP